MTLEMEDLSSRKRRLILRDSLTFLSLVLITVVLFAITLFLFRSFMAHRVDLAHRWSDRGQAALEANHPDQAIIALHTALSYAPGERTYELLLAQALGRSGRYEEAWNYFLVLWETTPGDGFINLQLARLAVKKNNAQTAINYYRAAIYGTWEGDGSVRRREVRLELARYLIARRDFNTARVEILIAGGNAPDEIPLRLMLAGLLEQAQAPQDALSYYKKVLLEEPDNEEALRSAGRLEYSAGEYEEAHRLLEEALRGDGRDDPDRSADLAMMDHAERVLALAPSKTLPQQERVTRILKAREVAKQRFSSCSAQAGGSSAAALEKLSGRWSEREAALSRAALLKDSAAQDTTLKLIFDTEVETAKVCGEPTGDDAALLSLFKYPKVMEP